MEAKLTDPQIARAFALKYHHEIAWLRRKYRPNQPYYWCVRGRWDDTGTAAARLLLQYLKESSARSPRTIGADTPRERIDRLLEMIKPLVTE